MVRRGAVFVPRWASLPLSGNVELGGVERGGEGHKGQDGGDGCFHELVFYDGDGCLALLESQSVFQFKTSNLPQNTSNQGRSAGTAV